MKTNLIAAILLATSLSTSFAQQTIVKDGKAKSRIVLTDNLKNDSIAATLLQDFVHRISGATMPIIKDNAKKGDIVIRKVDDASITEDGFKIESKDGMLHISSIDANKGNIYGVVTLLENYMGIECFAANCYNIPKQNTITLPHINIAQNPAFRYRQTGSYSFNQDPIYRLWFRLEEPSDEFASNLWVHTFARLLPIDKYGNSHPEYYSLINGKRRPGNASQWCLTNPELFEIVAQRVDSIFKANPEAKMISVSQNDGNFTNCQCDECRKVDEYEGALSGNFIRFLNKLAKRFPDKQFSTLAYLFTMQPPKHVKPEKNVNIMLCDIDCKREVPLTDNASGREFVQALEGWSNISDNLFVWDYGINFDNMVSPFPNFHIIQKNMQLFHKHHTKMHFLQINGPKGCDFSEMRSYMAAKLMWNPYLDADSLMQKFMNGYYGKGATYIYQYEKMLEGALLASNKDLWIYDSPVTHKDGMLNAKCRKIYNELFDKAEEAVKDDNTLLNRIRLTRLSLQYSELEIMRAAGIEDKNNATEKLNLFEKRCKEFGVSSLNERNNPPAEYCQLYRERYMPNKKVNLAKGAHIDWKIAPAKGYRNIADKALTDGLYGGTTFVESWVGWEGENASFTIDLGKVRQISSISTDFLHQLGAWILLPKKVSYSTSTDGKNFSDYGSTEIAEDRDPKVKFVPITSHKKTEARYIKVFVEGTIECPSWHYGIGHKSWFFLDEVTVE